MARQLTATACRNAGCRYLSARQVQTDAGLKTQAYCKLSDLAPGRMLACPMKRQGGK